MKTFFLYILASFTIYLVTQPIANADVSSQPLYGGGQANTSSGAVSIDKKVASPSGSMYVDNLTINDPKYNPGDIVKFQLNLANTGNANIKTIEIRDTLPQFMNFISGPGIFDANTKTLSFQVENLKPGETRTFSVEGQVVRSNRLPVNLGTICMTNQVNAATPDFGTSQDNSLFCVQKGALGEQTKSGSQVESSKGGFPVYPPSEVSSTPDTGPGALALISLIPTGIAGWILRKYSKQKSS